MYETKYLVSTRTMPNLLKDGRKQKKERRDRNNIEATRYQNLINSTKIVIDECS